MIMSSVHGKMSGPELQVALVLPDLRREESLASALSSVAHLAKLSEHIFSTIEEKCDEFFSKLEGFNKVLMLSIRVGHNAMHF